MCASTAVTRTARPCPPKSSPWSLLRPPLEERQGGDTPKVLLQLLERVETSGAQAVLQWPRFTKGALEVRSADAITDTAYVLPAQLVSGPAVHPPLWR